MNLLEGAALGLLQGVAEFLPISSSGHLAVAERLFGLGYLPLLFDVALHLATLAAVLVAFRGRVASLLASLGRWIARRSGPEDEENLRCIVALLAGTLLTGVIGILLEKLAPVEDLKLVSSGFLATAVLLVCAERLARRTALRGAETGKRRPPGLREGVLVGIGQGIGVLPGVSRSGITIASALAAGIERDKAYEFSFLLSIPAVLGAFVLELRHADELARAVDALPLCAGMALAFLSGLLALRLLSSLLRRGRLWWFAVYLVPLGIAGLLFL